jgi:hypothetical protein
MSDQRLQQQAVSDSARIESQEDIAERRDDTNRLRIDVQREASQRRSGS